jgi:hypothetical protein
MVGCAPAGFPWFRYKIKNGRVAKTRSPVGFLTHGKKVLAILAGKSHVKRGKSCFLM